MTTLTLTYKTLFPNSPLKPVSRLRRKHSCVPQSPAMPGCWGD